MRRHRIPYTAKRRLQLAALAEANARFFRRARNVAVAVICGGLLLGACVAGFQLATLTVHHARASSVQAVTIARVLHPVPARRHRDTPRYSFITLAGDITDHNLTADDCAGLLLLARISTHATDGFCMRQLP